MQKTQFAVVSVERYIKLRFANNKARFARHCNVFPQTVSKWIAAGYVIGDGCIYSQRRKIGEEK